MKKLLTSMIIILFAIAVIPTKALAAAGIYASGGGTKTIGQNFTITVSASGTTFDSFKGAISVSGPVKIISFNAGSADFWKPAPANNASFNGALLGRKTTSQTIATIKLQGTAAGSGSVSVSNVALLNAGSVVGSGAGGVSFTIQKAPELPGAVTISSTSHPDQNTAYEATDIVLNWDKASGVDGFSYLLDQAPNTTPESKTTDSNTTVTYQGKAVGIYYFHIKAHKPDGWGTASHFTINIKEPDPKINESLNKPSDIKISRLDNAVNDIDNGTLAGISIAGITEANYTTNITLSPAPTIPEGKSLSAKADENGIFNLQIDFPLKAGFYKLTIQGQLDKVLTPISDSISFEISLKEGGKINLISSTDIKPPVVEEQPRVKGSFLHKEYPLMSYLIITLGAAILALGAIEITKLIKRRKNQVHL